MSASPMPYDLVHCKKVKKGNGSPSLLRRGDGNSRMLKPQQHGDADEDCVTLQLCLKGDEYNHWISDCEGSCWSECISDL